MELRNCLLGHCFASVASGKERKVARKINGHKMH
jgi:hypothetical protein